MRGKSRREQSRYVAQHTPNLLGEIEKNNNLGETRTA
jgi:hypothetical protein